MMATVRYLSFLLLSIGFLVTVGCVSPAPVQLLLLEPGVQINNRDGGITVGLRTVALPEYLRRNGLVYSETGHSVAVSGYARWAEPLEDGVLRVTTINLAELLATSRMQTYPWQASQRPEVDIAINIIELSANASQARLSADVQIRTKDSGGNNHTQQFIKSWQSSLTGDSRAVDIARAYSELLLEMAHAIAAVSKAQ